MFPTKSINTTNQPLPEAEPLPSTGEEVALIMPRGLRKPFYTNPATGQRHWEPMWFLQTLALLMMAGAFGIIFSMPDIFEVWPFPLLFAPLYALGFLAMSWQYLPSKVVMSGAGFVSSVLLLKRPWKLEFPRSSRAWSTLECVRLQKAEAMSETAVMVYGHCDCLVFDWRGGKRWFNSYNTMLANTSFINLWALTPAERENLFASLSRFVPQEVLSPEVLYLQVKTLSGDGSSNLNEYTQVWMEEYNRHFEISNYAPLPPGSKCGDGRFVISMTIKARINSSTYVATSAGGQRIIIKELVAPIDSDDLMQKKLLEQFNREAAILANLNHPSIVSVIDHFIENGRSYIVMEQASGRNIREHVRLKGFLPEAEVIGIARQLASVLQYLHHHSPGILHRDFTPDNLIYGQDGSVTVIDFGAANVYNTGKTATLIGKQGYMPPEQLRGKPSPASDIYAFGATLSFLLTGKDLASMGTLPAINTGEISPELLSLIQKCLSLDPEGRPDCDEIIKALEPIKSPTPAIKT